MNVLPACLLRKHTKRQYLLRPEEGIRSLGVGIMCGCKLPCGCCGMKTSPLEELGLLLTIEPSLRPHRANLNNEYNLNNCLSIKCIFLRIIL